MHGWAVRAVAWHKQKDAVSSSPSCFFSLHGDPYLVGIKINIETRAGSARTGQPTSLQSRPQPNYLKHAGEGQAYMHKLLVQSGGDLNRLNADDRSFVESVLGGHAHRYFPIMYRGMTSKTKPGAATSSNHGHSSDTN